MKPWLVAVLAALAAAPQAGAQQRLAPDSAVRTLLDQRLPAARGGGIVVGIIDSAGPRIVAVGAPPNAVFEIGSVTKVFTASVLAVLAAEGVVGLDDPVAKLLPAWVRVPSRNGREITLLDLVTHASGLPRLPTNLAPRDSSNPYADYTVEQLYAFLSTYELPRDVGQTYEYSNLGAGLLGHALARKSGSSYEEVVIRRVIAPLGMRETVIILPLGLRARLAPGHDFEGRVVPNWDLPTLAGAGALRSTAGDMLKFLAANLDTSRAPLARALRETHRTRRPVGRGTMMMGMGWHVLPRPAGAITWHNGATGGYRSFVGFDAARRVGVVMLTNSSVSLDDLGFHLLDPTLPLPPPPRPRTEVAVAPAVLDRYVGEYELAPTFHIVVTREGAGLFLQASGQPRFPVFAESDSTFFLKVVDAQVDFVRDATGKVTGLVLHQNGQDIPGRKIR